MTQTPRDLTPEPLTRPEQVAELVESIHEHRIFALDTEFITERTYRPQLALVQVATPDLVAVLDPLAGQAVDQPIWDAVADAGIVTVVHAHEQESRFCVQRCGRPPENLFDVQLAAGFCGYHFPIAHGALVRGELDREVAASQSRTDWTLRPLSESQLRYAADDVAWLLPLYEGFRERLASDERERWLREETETRTAALEPDAQADIPRWRKLSGRRRLSRRGLAALRELHGWRDRVAATTDSPLKRIARDESLVAIASTLPRSLDDLARVRGGGEVARRHRAEIVEAVARSLELPDSELPERLTNTPSPPRTLMSFVAALLESLCDDHEIDSQLLASHADVRELINWVRRSRRDGEPPRLLRGWRRELAGETILAALEGRVSLRVGDATGQQPLVAERR